MLTTIEVMPDTARLWVYQADRSFNASEIDYINDQTQAFLNQWAAHGKGLAASYELSYDQFLMIMVDERQEAASGCSIDASVGLIKALEQQLQVSFLDRSKVAILKNEKIELLPFNGVKKAIAEGVITSETIVFNNAVSNYGDWKRNWKQKASASWMARFFN